MIVDVFVVAIAEVVCRMITTDFCVVVVQLRIQAKKSTNLSPYTTDYFHIFFNLEAI
jgi:hypothetical protein